MICIRYLYLLKPYFMRNPHFFLLGILILFFSCKSDDEVEMLPEIQNETLVDFSVVKKINSLEVSAIYAALTTGLPPDKMLPLTLGSVTVYKLTYKTTYPGETNKVLASGALVVPDRKNTNPIVSYQHGTILNPNEIPSLAGNNSQNGFAVVLSALGFYVSAPDYLGYGDNKSYHHLYEHGASLATASYDMLLATREFLRSNDHNIDDKLFLTGYSEGGYATMALHQHIEKEGKLRVTASVAGAGAYNKSAFASEVLALDVENPFIRSYLWVLDTYNRVYNIKKPWSYYINEPYASNIDENNPLSVFTATVSMNPKELFTQSFRDEVLQKKNSEFNSALKDNDRFDWKPEAPVRLIYGTKDNYVFPSNSITAYEAIKARGADVTLIPLANKNHSTAVNDFGFNVLLWFLALK